MTGDWLHVVEILGVVFYSVQISEIVFSQSGKLLKLFGLVVIHQELV